MCDFSHLTEALFKGLPKLKEGQQIFVVALRDPADGDIEIESILYADASDTPQEALVDFCKAQVLDAGSRICIPVVLPEGLMQEDAKGFRAVRNGASLHIEFTQ